MQKPEDKSVETFAKSMMTHLYANGLSHELFLECSRKWKLCSIKFQPMVAAGFCSVYTSFTLKSEKWYQSEALRLYLSLQK